MDANVKVGLEGERRATLCAFEVPLTHLERLHLLVSRIGESLSLLLSRVIGTSRFSMAVDMEGVAQLFPLSSGDWKDWPCIAL